MCRKCDESVLKVDVQVVSLNLRVNYYCESLSLIPAGPTFANSDGEVSTDDEDSTQSKQVRFTVTQERAEELVSSLCGVIWKQKSHSWSEVCTGVAALTKTDGKKLREAMEALAAVTKLHSQLTTKGKYIYRIEGGGDRLGFLIGADTSHLLAMVAVGPKKPLTFYSFATGAKGTKVPQGRYLFQTMRPFDSFQCIPNARGHIYLFFFDFDENMKLVCHTNTLRDSLNPSDPGPTLDALRRIERKLDAITEHLGIEQ